MTSSHQTSREDKKLVGLPQGIAERHFAPRTRNPAPNLSAVLFFAGILLASFLGVFGGQPHPQLKSKAESATLMVASPDRIRNGELFEIRVEAAAHRPISDATLEVSASFWKDLTINTMIPSPEREEAINGKYRFSFGPLSAGDTLSIKVDGQINPPLFAGNSGNIALYDGERKIADIPVTMKVWP